MPYIDDFEVCRQIKRDPEKRLTPVVLITGLSAVEDRARGIKAGADDFLSKPLERIELAARVHPLFKLKASTAELARPDSVLSTLARRTEPKNPSTSATVAR